MKTYIRLPKSQNLSLKPWSAVDEYMLKELETSSFNSKSKFLVFGDRFGFLSNNLIDRGSSCYSYIISKSQLDSIQANCVTSPHILKYGDDLPEVSHVLIKIPKSHSLLELYLDVLLKLPNEPNLITLGFMTKYFNQGILKTLEKYFDEIEQTKAWKKSRLIKVSGQKGVPLANEISSFTTPIGQFKHYKGVFSENSIDIGTSFLLEQLNFIESGKRVLDLGSGIGVISKYLREKYDLKDIHLIDDNYLAYLSGKLNIKDATHCWDYNLENIPKNHFDLVISNPPFHFGHEIDFSIPMDLLRSTYKIIKPGGRLLIVANNFINYKSTLSDLFTSVKIINRNKKFYILEALK